MSFAKMKDLFPQIAEVWENKTKEMLSLKMISFVLFPQVSVPSLNDWSIIPNSV